MGRVWLRDQYQGELDLPLVVVKGEKMAKFRDTRGVSTKVLQSR